MKIEKVKVMSDEVIKTNRLISALQNLSHTESRIMQLAVIDSTETQTGLAVGKPLRITALRYAKAFDVDPATAYKVILDAEATLFERRFTFINERDNPVKSRWVSQVEYIKGEGAIEIMLTPAVVQEITRIDGNKDIFTKYMLGQTAVLNSVYSLRLYELLAQWRLGKKTPIFELETFRGQLGLEVNQYKRMSDFKRRVLDYAVAEINAKTDLKVSYKQEKDKSTIIGFKFLVIEKPKAKADEEIKLRDVNNGDMFTIDGLSDKQLWRISRHKEFISTYSSLAKGDAGKSWSAYSDFIVGEIKKDASKFSKKRPIREYLDGNEAEYDFSR